MEPTESSREQNPGAARVFVTTRWSLVLAAGRADEAEAMPALDTLCRAYWYPIYAHLRREGRSPADAQDLTQEFFSRLLARGDFAAADPAKGRFRSYLLGALKHFLADERDRANAAKRGGGTTAFSLEGENAEARFALEIPGGDLPDREFDRRWATTLLDAAMRQLEAGFVAAGKRVQFDALKSFLSAPPGADGYDAVAAQLGMSTGAVTVAVHRLRARYGELVRAEIANTVESPAEVEGELRQLFAALA